LNLSIDQSRGAQQSTTSPCCAASPWPWRPRSWPDAASLGFAIDSVRALQQTGACKFQAPPASQCNGKRALKKKKDKPIVAAIF
jgi:hypothetical protein